MSDDLKICTVPNPTDPRLSNLISTNWLSSMTLFKPVVFPKASVVDDKPFTAPVAAPLAAKAPVATEKGIASYYNLPGNRTASGQMFNANALTAAHRTLPLGSVVRVINARTGKSVIVTINDRGPFADKARRILDVTPRVKNELGLGDLGAVKIEVLERRAVRSSKRKKSRRGKVKPKTQAHKAHKN